MLDWNLLRTVLEVSREGSISKAAKSLGVNIATLSRQLGRAEEALEAKLFDRRNQGVFPTEAGLRAIKTATAMEKKVEALELSLSGSNLSEEGTIRFSMPLNVMPYGFAQHIRAFQIKYPKIALEINATDDPVDFESLEADVVLRVGESPPDSLWGYKIASVGVSFFASKDFLSRWREDMEQNPETAKIPYVQLYTANTAADEAEFLSRFPNGEKVASCNGMDSLIPMVRDGIGAGRMMRYMARAFNDLELVFDCDEQWSRTVWVLTHADLKSVHRIRLFIEFLKDRFAENKFKF